MKKGAREVAQSVKRSTYKQENLRSTPPPHPCEKLGMVVCFCNPHAGWGSRDSRSLELASGGLALINELPASGRPCLKKWVGST